MKALLVGFIFFIITVCFLGIGFLMLPFLLALVLLLRVIFVFILVLLAVWLLGKLIIFVWEKIR